MQLFDPNNPNEKKKMIAAAVLGLAAIIVLGYLLLGGGSTKPNPRAAASPTPTPRRAGNQPPAADIDDDKLDDIQPIKYDGTFVGAPEADRNIFAYYVPPPPPVKQLPTPTPTPTPPLMVTSVSPVSVYARTGDFSLQVGGDKFAPGVRIVIDGRAMTTRFISPQQLATTVTSDMIANPGTRRIEARTADGALYSNVAMLNVTPAPVPNFTYVGLIGRPRGNDIAVLQDKNTKDLLNFQRGELVGGRFRITSISDKEVLLVDTNLKITHKLTFSPESTTGGRPPARRAVVDDDPQL
jgi:hypothetical protein